MTTEKYTELYNKYEVWRGRPIELAMDLASLGNQTNKKFLLKEISRVVEKEHVGKESVTTFVILQDLETGEYLETNLAEFDKTVRLIQLSSAHTVKLSNQEKSVNIRFGNNLEYVEVFIIQLNSHFGEKAEEWMKIVKNLYLDFNSTGTNQNPPQLTDRIHLSSFTSNQIQPVFYLSKKYPAVNPNESNSTSFYDALEIVVGELSPINEDYEITIVYNNYP
jgi:hypothetical protein